jgi:hypothetical protein
VKLQLQVHPQDGGLNLRMADSENVQPQKPNSDGYCNNILKLKERQIVGCGKGADGPPTHV